MGRGRRVVLPPLLGVQEMGRALGLDRLPALGERERLWGKVAYRPWPEQVAVHDDPGRLRLVAGGEGSGKSRLAAMELLWRAASRSGRYWLVGAEYRDCYPETDYLHAAARDLGLLEGAGMPDEGARRLVLSNGSLIETVTSADERRLAGYGADGVVMAEAARQTYEAFQRVRGRVARNRGWMLLVGVFEGSLGWYADLWAAWQGPGKEGCSYSIPTWVNRVLYPGGREDPEVKALEASCSRERFLERYGGEPSPPAGRVLAPFSAVLHVRPLVAVAEQPVELAIDPGYAGAYAVEFVQVVAGQLRVLDEVYVQGMVTEEVVGLCRRKDLWPLVKGGVIDVAARQHHAAPPVAHVWWKESGLRLRSQRVEAGAGIERLRSLLAMGEGGEPRLLVDPRCRAFLGEAGVGPHPIPGMAVWRYRTDPSGNVVGPPEERNNHAAKALIYYAVDRFGFGGRIPVVRRRAMRLNYGQWTARS